MPKPLTLEQQVWVENTLAHMTLRGCVGHLLMPDTRRLGTADLESLFRELPFGSVRVDAGDPAVLLNAVDAVQAHSRVPVVVAADVEAGIPGGTGMPCGMAFGAADDPALARAAARVVAREARAVGIHWVFQPGADILYRFQNPELGLSAFGDKPARVRALVAAQVRGFQDDGLLAATARHFPGAGADDRDQRVCTVLNPFAMGKWRRTYGSVWRSAFDAGVLAVMAGHIALPDYEGMSERPSGALPATLSARLQGDLLRGELGFAGVIVSNELAMAGMASRARAEDLAVRFVLAGGDVALTSEPRRDFARLMHAVHDGQLTEARVRESARRVLELKARAGLFRALRAAEVNAAEAAAHAALAQEVADRAVTVWKHDGVLPLRLPAGARVLTVTACPGLPSSGPLQELTIVDEELRRRGFVVDHLHNPERAALDHAAERCDLVCVNTGGDRHVPDAVNAAGGIPSWREEWGSRRNVVLTVFGSPFVVYQAPHWPNVVLTYGACAACQRAAVKTWLGELDPRGSLPVTLPRF